MAYSDPANQGPGQNQPMLMTIRYGEENCPDGIASLLCDAPVVLFASDERPNGALRSGWRWPQVLDVPSRCCSIVDPEASLICLRICAIDN